MAKKRQRHLERQVKAARDGIDAANDTDSPEETLKALGPVLVALTDGLAGPPRLYRRSWFDRLRAHRRSRR